MGDVKRELAIGFEMMAEGELAARGPAPIKPKGKGTLRPVNVVDREGNVRRVATNADVLEGLLRRQGIADATVEGKKPTRSFCSKCRTIIMAKDHHGMLPKMCAKCKPPLRSGTCACGNLFKQSRNGKCRSCAALEVHVTAGHMARTRADAVPDQGAEMRARRGGRQVNMGAIAEAMALAANGHSAKAISKEMAARGRPVSWSTIYRYMRDGGASWKACCAKAAARQAAGL